VIAYKLRKIWQRLILGFLHYTYNHACAEDKLITEKKQIAAKAFQLIETNDSIILDSGTTILELAKLIGESEKSVFVITNYTSAIQYLTKNKNIDIFLLGGNLNNITRAAHGFFTEEPLNHFHVNKAFLGVNGVSIFHGLTCSKVYIARLKEKIIAAASNTFLLADHTKMEKVSLCKFGQIDSVSKIITDDNLDKELYEKYQSYIL
jgi:DeoR family fructose operon transcriptional repressor